MSNIINNVQIIQITQCITPQRIDNYLFSKFKKTPKSIIYKILRTGQIKVNKKKVLPKYKIQEGDIIRIPPLQNRNNNKKKEITNYNDKLKLKQKILFEDEHILVINKPSGIAVHGGSGIHLGIIEQLRILYYNYKYLELVHRIDKETSGVLLVAKKRTILNHLHQQFRDHKIKKIYIALIHGHWSNHNKTIKIPLLKKLNSIAINKKKVYVHQLGKISETQIKIIKYYKLTTLIYAIPITGRTHQIRVHTTHMGHPVVFDNRYGSKILDTKIDSHNRQKRLLLHARSISFIHPFTKKQLCIKAPLDCSFEKYL
ncbi:MAG: RluA family pseudouridine synthase [Buchnera aphidicola (Eriosoma harunire)]